MQLILELLSDLLNTLNFWHNSILKSNYMCGRKGSKCLLTCYQYVFCCHRVYSSRPFTISQFTMEHLVSYKVPVVSNVLNCHVFSFHFLLHIFLYFCFTILLFILKTLSIQYLSKMNGVCFSNRPHTFVIIN